MLREATVEEDMRKADLWTAHYRAVEVTSRDAETPAGPLDPFFNTDRLRSALPRDGRR